MKHLIICPEHPPAPLNQPGGIGTYVANISRLLAEAGETVHVIGTRWEGAPKSVEHDCDGRRIVHRVPLDEFVPKAGAAAPRPASEMSVVEGLARSDFRPQCFAYQVSLLAERLIEDEGIDVIEAQEFDAPLYYFQLRRALGLGPRRRPPCIVQMHSPSELIVQHNEYDPGHPYFVSARRLEGYSIAAADARMCPSRYLARQVEQIHGLEAESIEVVRYPIGDTPRIERDADVWSRGTICYMGRLEPRKGVIEWVDAAIQVAGRFPQARFEFLGADMRYGESDSMRQFLLQRVPQELRERFLFRGPQKRAELPRFLARARAAAVPSRWENFPNTCIESMCTGLPVIASRDGGMAEMVEDGETGWLAPQPGSHGLADALERALGTPPQRISEMGAAAAETIRKLCDNAETVRHNIEFRRRVARSPASASCRVPVQPCGSRPARQAASPPTAGLAIVIRCAEQRRLEGCLDTIRKQTRAPAAVALVGGEAHPSIPEVRDGRWHDCVLAGSTPAELRNHGVDAVLRAGIEPLGFVFIDAADRLRPAFVEKCESVLRECPEVGIVTPWFRMLDERYGLVARPCPALPYQLLVDDTSGPTTIRAEALRESGAFRDLLFDGFEHWDLASSVIARGWLAITYPELLCERGPGAHSARHVSPATRGQMRQVMLARTAEAVSSNASELVALLENHAGWRCGTMNGSARAERILRPSDLLRVPFSEKLRLAHRALRKPQLAVKFLWWHGSKAGAKLFRRDGDA